jgi:tetratricopeptide (TPR) repeat protein
MPTRTSCIAGAGTLDQPPQCRRPADGCRLVPAVDSPGSDLRAELCRAGDSYILLTGNYGRFLPAEGAALGVAAAGKAIELDGSLAEPHVSLAYVRYYLQWDWAEAEAEFRRALDLNPSYAAALDLYGDFLTAMGRFDEAIQSTKRAQELDPLSLVVSRGAAWPLFFARRYEEAIAQLQRTLTLDSTYVSALSLLGRAHIENGQYVEGLAELQEGRAADRCVSVPRVAGAWVRALRSARHGDETSRGAQAASGWPVRSALRHRPYLCCAWRHG